MSRFATFVRSLLRDEDGPTAVEYAVLLGLIFAAAAGAISLVGAQSNTVFQQTAKGLPAPPPRFAP